MTEFKIPREKAEWPIYRKLAAHAEALVVLALETRGDPLPLMRDGALAAATNALACLAETALSIGGRRDIVYGALHMSRSALHALWAALRLAVLAAPPASRSRWEALQGEAEALIGELEPVVREFAPPQEDEEAVVESEPAPLN